MPTPELLQHFTCANTKKIMTDPVLIFRNKELVAVERESVAKNYHGPVYEAPTLKKEIEKWQEGGDRNKTQVDKADYTRSYMILGEQGTGKTQFLKSLTNENFNQEYISTIDAAFFTKTIEINDAKVKLNILDPAHLFKENWGNSYTGIILTYDVTHRDSLGQLTSWLKQIEAKYYVDQLTIQIVGTKNDLRAERCISLEMAKDFVKKFNEENPQFNLLVPVETSAKSKANILDPLVALTKQIVPEINTKKEIKTQNSSEIDFTSAIDKLKNYKNYRGQDERDLYHGHLSSLFGGYSKQQKFAAVDILIEVLEGKKTKDFLAPYEKILKQGSLGTIYKDISPLLSEREELTPNLKI